MANLSTWTLDDIPWHRFDPGRVDPELLPVIKAAALVERNGGDYERYLTNVFARDPLFQADVRGWAAEEVRHGQALGRWAELADPGFDFAAAFDHFRAGYRLPLEARASVRGSRTGELVARCMVEVGTSSFYSALRDAAAEPVLADICGRIAVDEFRHYKLFYSHMQRYAVAEKVGRLRRVVVALERLREVDDDELAFAYHCGNENGTAYDRRRCNRAYARRALRRYKYPHVERGTAMALKAAGLAPRGRLHRLASRLAWRALRRRAGADMDAV